MFEYYKYKLSSGGKRVHSEEQAKESLGKKVWLLSLILALSFGLIVVASPEVGVLLFVVSTSVMLLLLGLLVSELTQTPIKDLIKKLLISALIVVGLIILVGVLSGLVAVLTHTLFRGSHNLGQIAIMNELITRIIILLLIPIVIIVILRLVQEEKLISKIRKKVYIELLIIFTIGLLLSWLPNQMVFRSLMLTQVVQLLFITIINTLLICAVITTSRNRGILS
jgi:hypothetical protein